MLGCGSMMRIGSFIGRLCLFVLCCQSPRFCVVSFGWIWYLVGRYRLTDSHCVAKKEQILCYLIALYTGLFLLGTHQRERRYIGGRRYAQDNSKVP